MKPVSILERNRCGSNRFVGRFPLIDCNYRPTFYADLYGGHGANYPAPSFRSISRNYFGKEARHNFVIEAFLFAGTIFSSAVALVISALAAIDFLRTLGYF